MESKGGSESERSYNGVKVKLELEEYLQFTAAKTKAGKTKAALMEIISGANDLKIELGRRRRVGVAERICAECRGGVEDEMYERTRQAMLEQISEVVVRVHGDSREESWSCLMGGYGRPQWRILSRGVARMLAERKRRRE